MRNRPCWWMRPRNVLDCAPCAGDSSRDRNTVSGQRDKHEMTPLPASDLYKFFIPSLVESAAMKPPKALSPVAKIVFPTLLVAFALLLQAQEAQPRPNLSGNWVFNPQKSSLKMPAPTSLTLRIEQADSQVHFSRTQLYGEQRFHWDLDTVADGQKEVVQKEPQYTANVRVYWQGTSLVLDQQITADDGTKATDVVTYSLADGDKTLEAVERQTVVGGKGIITNKWVYERMPQ